MVYFGRIFQHIRSQSISEIFIARSGTNFGSITERIERASHVGHIARTVFFTLLIFLLSSFKTSLVPELFSLVLSAVVRQQTRLMLLAFFAPTLYAF